jgi:two-component system chemotaxis response regulator CheY
MASRRVLSVGHCGFDHNRIAHHFRQSFDAQVDGVSTFAEALDALRGRHYDLVLINRINDEDGAPGLELIRDMKAEAELADVPVMLVSNYAEAQQAAEALGARPGFGKSELTTPQTRTRLESILGATLPAHGGRDADR